MPAVCKSPLWDRTTNWRSPFQITDLGFHPRFVLTFFNPSLLPANLTVLAWAWRWSKRLSRTTEDRWPSNQPVLTAPSSRSFFHSLLLSAPDSKFLQIADSSLTLVEFCRDSFRAAWRRRVMP